MGIALPEGERRLAAIMFTDMLGYTALSQRSEAHALKMLDEYRMVLRPFFPRHSGREVKTIGDAFLVEFASALEAVRCAYEIQESLHELNEQKPKDDRILIRIGVHLGDVVHSGDDVYGDAVNVASRIDPLAIPGGICVTEQVFDQVKNKIEFPLSSLGKRELKNVGEPVQVYRVVLPWEKEEELTEGLDARRIAVLPLRNMSPDPNDEYFADGMTEELITTLSKAGQLTVLARTSVMQYRNTTKRVSEIAKELNTGTLIEGSVRKAANKVRISVQLLDAKTEGHLWAENYDRDLNDIFQIQSDVAKQVFEALKVRILPAENVHIKKAPTSNPVAYTLYLQGRYHWNKRGVEDIKRAAKFFEEALRQDPSFARGYAGLADCHELMAINWQTDIHENHERAKKAATKALELDPDLAEAHATRGLILANEYNLAEAKDEYKRAIELEPSYATAHQWYASLLFAEKKYAEGLREIETAVELDPLSQIIYLNLAGFHQVMKDYKTAVELFRKAVDMNPSFGTGHLQLGFALGKLNMYDEAKREIGIGTDAVQSYFPYMRAASDMLLAYLRNDKEEIRRLLPEIEAHRAETALSINEVANCYFLLGESDKGFELLEESFRKKEPELIQIQNDEFLDGVKEDPRYHDLLKRLGLE